MRRKIGIYLLIIFIILILVPLLLVKEQDDEKIVLRVYNHQLDKIVEMELNQYLRGVLAAEMPARYHPEALKAQAVAARTYTLKQLPRYGGSRNSAYKGADVSTDYRECQAYFSEREMKDRWGFIPFFYYWSRINTAVEETAKQVLVYDGKLIDAVYHANSGGRTENAEYVWGRNTPYLKSVES
ncbi:MAG: SpoIID/LytB domain-containing protein, partial [Halanaerobiales bacterium]